MHLKGGQIMKAVQVLKYGHTDKMTLSHVQRPKVDNGRVLVKIHDAGVNPVDWKIREGFLKDIRPASFPYTMGQDFAGEVDAYGQGVSGFKRGDKVFGFAQGTYAEYALASPDSLALMPRSLDFETAASIPTAGLTAWQIVMDAARLTQEQTVLILGAAGGVGSFAVQFAKRTGARVFATASPDDFSYLQEIGVDQILDYHSERIEEIFEGVDVVIDLVGGDTLKHAYRAVKQNGLIVTTVGPADEAEAKKYNARVIQFVMQRNAEELSQIGLLVEKGEIKPRISQVIPLDEAKQAEDLSQMGHPHGKVILRVA